MTAPDPYPRETRVRGTRRNWGLLLLSRISVAGQAQNIKKGSKKCKIVTLRYTPFQPPGTGKRKCLPGNVIKDNHYFLFVIIA